jgi:hypothetical protein
MYSAFMTRLNIPKMTGETGTKFIPIAAYNG